MPLSLLLSLLSGVGISLTAATATPYVDKLGAQDSFAVLYAMFTAASGATNPVAFAKVVSDGAACPAQLKQWLDAGKLGTAVQASLQSQTSICDWIDLGSGQPGSGSGGGGGSGGDTPPAAGTSLTQAQVNAILASFDIGISTSLSNLIPTIPIISQIVQNACSAGTTRSATGSCPAADAMLTAATNTPDLVEWAYQQGTLVKAVQASVDTGKPLAAVILEQQQAAGVTPGTGAAPAPAASSSIVVPLIAAGGVAAVLVWLATRNPARRSYVKVR